MKSKTFNLFLCSIILSGTVSGCGTNKSTANIPPSSSAVEETTEVSTVQITETEYKTMEPPEGGWTIEELMSVTYLCGKQLTYPLTIEYLGEDFSLDEANKTELKLSIGYPLLYKDKKIGLVGFEKNSENSSDYDNITTIMFNTNVSSSALDCIVVNGISLGSINTDVKSMIGTPCDKSTDGRYAYTIQNGDDKFLDIIFIKKKDVAGINFYLKKE
ncbi:MAG: hypothetical protein IJY29_02680 [Ruminococcus sp.]|nr:hypothetical protein [Ruminococcus sp.]